MMTFDDLMRSYAWLPIRNCPGRFRLTGVRRDLSVEELLGEGIESYEFRVEGARDIVVVAPLDGGGAISYKRSDGTLLHTLNTPEGFERKLLQLGMDMGILKGRV